VGGVERRWEMQDVIVVMDALVVHSARWGGWCYGGGRRAGF
jgi:hypothetical protein